MDAGPTEAPADPNLHGALPPLIPAQHVGTYTQVAEYSGAELRLTGRSRTLLRVTALTCISLVISIFTSVLFMEGQLALVIPLSAAVAVCFSAAFVLARLGFTMHISGNPRSAVIHVPVPAPGPPAPDPLPPPNVERPAQ